MGGGDWAQEVVEEGLGLDSVWLLFSSEGGQGGVDLVVIGNWMDHG